MWRRLFKKKAEQSTAERVQEIHQKYSAVVDPSTGEDAFSRNFHHLSMQEKNALRWTEEDMSAENYTDVNDDTASLVLADLERYRQQ